MPLWSAVGRSASRRRIAPVVGVSLSQKLSQLYIKTIKHRERVALSQAGCSHPWPRKQDFMDDFMAVGRKFRSVVQGEWSSTLVDYKITGNHARHRSVAILACAWSRNGRKIRRKIILKCEPTDKRHNSSGGLLFFKIPHFTELVMRRLTWRSTPKRDLRLNVTMVSWHYRWDLWSIHHNSRNFLRSATLHYHLSSRRDKVH